MIGIDAVDVERLRAVMERSRGTERRLFTPAESTYCRARPDPVVHFAGTLAVKEAVIKAARLGPLSAWARRIEVQRDPTGAPRVHVAGEDRAHFEISISHDGPVAVAVAMAVGSVLRPAPAERATAPAGTRPNLQLMRYLSPGPSEGRETLGLARVR